MKIYVRERQKVGEGVRQPKYRIVAITGGEIQVVATHFRKRELELIAQDIGAEIIWLHPAPDNEKKRH